MQVWLDTGPLQQNISVTIPVRKKVSTDHLYETTYCIHCCQTWQNHL